MPQRLLTDNDSALNTSRRGWEGQLTAYVTSLGVAAITGKPGKPTTQGKNERFHQTLFRWLDKQPLAAIVTELQEQTSPEGVKIYDNTGDLLLEHPWPAPGIKHVSNGRPRGAGARRPRNITEALRSTGQRPGGEYRRTVRTDGRVSVRNVVYGIGKEHLGEELHILVDKATVTFWSTRTGELVGEHPLPEPGVKHVGYVRYNRAAHSEVSTMS